jgi:hypothetical protein
LERNRPQPKNINQTREGLEPSPKQGSAPLRSTRSPTKHTVNEQNAARAARSGLVSGKGCEAAANRTASEGEGRNATQAHGLEWRVEVKSIKAAASQQSKEILNARRDIENKSKFSLGLNLTSCGCIRNQDNFIFY